MLLHVCISVPTTGRKVCSLSEIAVDKERIHQLISSLKYYKIREHSKQRSSLTLLCKTGETLERVLVQEVQRKHP